MVFTPDFTSFTQPLPDETIVTKWFANTPFSAASTSLSVQPQPPHTPFPENQMGTYSTQVSYDAAQEVVQDPYLPLRYAFHSPYVPPLTEIASFDNSVHAAQWNENIGTGSSDAGLLLPPTVAPAAPQSFLFPSSPPTLTPRWFEIPQRLYEHTHRQWNFRQSEPIPFSVYGVPGINMEDALRKRFTGLDDRDDPMFETGAKAITCRFLFPGYPGRSAQIHTLGWAQERIPITRSKLAHDVAKQLNRYLNSMVGYPMDGFVDGQWEIGEGFMHLRNMFLVRLVSVSTGSFQPEIWIWVP